MKTTSYSKNLSFATTFFASIALCLAFLVSSSTGYALETFPHGSLTLQTAEGEKKLDVEIATTPAAQEQGMMFRREWKGLDGMIFTWPHEGEATFWMKNTYLPLDMIFINKQWRVQSWHENAEPLSLTPISSSAPVIAVLEVPAGSVKQWQLKKNSPVSYAPQAR